MTEKLLTAKEVSKLLSLPIPRIWDLTRRGLIPAVKVGERQYRYSEQKLNEWVANGGNRENGGVKDV